MNKEELDDTDKRESGYTREDIASHVEILSGGSVPKSEIYIYLNKFEEGQREKSVPTRDFPIVQSYVDICLTGCRQIEKGFPDAVGFAVEFIETASQNHRRFQQITQKFVLCKISDHRRREGSAQKDAKITMIQTG